MTSYDVLRVYLPRKEQEGPPIVEEATPTLQAPLEETRTSPWFLLQAQAAEDGQSVTALPQGAAAHRIIDHCLVVQISPVLGL